MYGRRLFSVVLALHGFAVLVSSALGEPEGGGGSIGIGQSGSCISETDRAFATQLIASYEQDRGTLSSPIAGAQPPKLTFFPMAGRIWGDLFDFNYVDLDPTSGFNDWDCTQFTYNGHNGNDMDIRSFGEQVIGVPIFAALDGVVVATHDGEDDMNTVWAGQPANFVIVDHGFGREGWYWHLKKNSVAVTIGQTVSAGAQIGLCASSGVSTGPHLHFEIRDDGLVHEPFSGPCRAGESGWVDQPPLDRSLYLHDFGVTHQSISAAGPWPFEWPRTGQMAFSDPVIRVWWYGTALPAGSTYRVQFRRPDGTLVTPSLNQGFGNPFWRWYNWWWTYSVPDMHLITGTWHVRLSINGDLMIEAPVEVVAARSPDFNRAPEPVTADLVPSSPKQGDVVSCQVNTSLTLDDLDYDIVRYEYVWTVDGNEVRHVTSAAHSDVLSRDFVTAGARIECTVTPGDGQENGSGDTAIAIVRTGLIPVVSKGSLVVTALLVLAVGMTVIRRYRDRFSCKA